LEICGWAIDADTFAPAGAVFVGINGVFYPPRYRLNRPDVAEYFTNKRLKDTGFLLSISSDNISRGTHNVTISIISHDNKGIYRPEKYYTIEITD
jgi:hypothetical protein